MTEIIRNIRQVYFMGRWWELWTTIVRQPEYTALIRDTIVATGPEQSMRWWRGAPYRYPASLNHSGVRIVRSVSPPF